MKRLAVLVAALALTLSGCGLLTPPGADVVQERVIDDVTAVVLSGGGTLTVAVGDAPSLTVTAGANIIDRVLSRSDDSTLTLGGKKGGGVLTGEVSYALTVTRLDSLTIEGSGEATADFTGSSGVTIVISGSGEVDASGLEAREVDVQIEGSGDVELAGAASRLGLSIEGSGEIDASDLQSASADAAISGSGSIDVFVSDSLNVQIDGSGEVRYTGGAAVRSELNGVGRVTEY